MLDDKAIQAAASALEEAERSRKQIRLLSETYPEITMDDAYAIQDCWIGMKLASGEKLAGWKIGLTSKAMQAAVSIDIPDSGVLLESMRFPNGAVIVPGRFIQPRIEAEIAFVMNGPLEGTATVEDVLAQRITLLRRWKFSIQESLARIPRRVSCAQSMTRFRTMRPMAVLSLAMRSRISPDLICVGLARSCHAMVRSRKRG
ncbi:hypothetical protein [Novosphingobium pentaromativorans]|uniref:hypothetical protein n=1 Tax=Novosphingobium pentaromativorans TaxID=205844 RepID=UPI001EF07334|nr:hypothetical protein [Novosphingobium pentaromativorans]